MKQVTGRGWSILFVLLRVSLCQALNLSFRPHLEAFLYARAIARFTTHMPQAANEMQEGKFAVRIVVLRKDEARNLEMEGFGHLSNDNERGEITRIRSYLTSASMKSHMSEACPSFVHRYCVRRSN